MNAAAAQQFAASDNVSLDQDAKPYVKALKAAATSGGAFLHYPRPPGTPGSIPDKRDYLAHIGLTTPANYLFGVGSELRLPLSLIIKLNRYSPAKTATLVVSTEDNSMNAGIALKPDALRELARMCIDAAHDIEVAP